MENQNFSTSIVVDQPASEVFNVVKNVRGWWSEEIECNTGELNQIFNDHYEDIHRCKIKLEEVIPGKKIVWHVMENYFKPGIIKDEAEWVDTKMVFDISSEAGKTRLTFTHQGLVPEYECFKMCSDGWTQYINHSLLDLITTGKGKPNKTGNPTTSHEKKFKEE